MKSGLMLGLFIASLAVIAAPSAKNIRETPEAENKIFGQYGKHPAVQEQDGRTVYLVHGGTIGRSRRFKVEPGSRLMVKFRVKNACRANTLEVRPGWEGILGIQGFKKVKQLSGIPTVSPVFFNAEKKLFRMPGHQRNYFRSVLSSEWQDHTMEFFVPFGREEMELWFFGSAKENQLLISDYSVRKVENAPTLNINPELRIDNFAVNGIERYINTHITAGPDGRAVFSFPKGNVCTCRIPVRPGGSLRVVVKTLPKSAGCRMFVTFQDGSGKNCGTLRDHVQIPNAEATRMETVLAVPKDAVSFFVLVRFGSMSAIRVEKIDG